jgi:hypothetical protein
MMFIMGEDEMKRVKVLNIDTLGSSPAKELPNRGNIDEHRPYRGEVSFQKYDGIPVYQWHYRTNRDVYWHASGPKFYIK